MAAWSMAARLQSLDRYEAPSSSSWSSTSSSSSSGDTTEEEENSSSSSWSSWSSSTCSSSSSQAAKKNKKKKTTKTKTKSKKKKTKTKKKSEKNKSKSIHRKSKSKSSTNRGDLGDENGDEVSSMLLLGVELLKEVEEASAAAAAAVELESRTTEELLPIGHYVLHGGSDRSTLLDQVLSSVPAAQWQAILPPVLKEMNGPELKQLCLHQLQLLSDSTILNIINGDGDQGPAVDGKTTRSIETGGKEGDKKKKWKKSKKGKKKGKKTKKKERSVGAGLLDGKEAGGQEEEESSGKTLMELLELEMRARAIKALLKKEEEGEDEGENDPLAPLAPAGPAGPPGPVGPVGPALPAPLAMPAPPATPVPPVSVRDDAIQRPFRAGQTDYSDKYKEQSIGHGHHQEYHRPSDLGPSGGPATKVSSVASYRPPSSGSTVSDVEQNRRRSDQVAFRQSHQPRHYRQQHQQHQHQRRYEPDRSRSPFRQSVVKTELNKNRLQSPDRRPSPFLATPPKVKEEPVSQTIVAVREMEQDVENDTVPGVLERQDEVEYEEEGIQEVDIELGSGSGSSSEDDAHSTRI